ncbi:PadR family transcriptional regulator [Shimazuella alba]|uniref:PadR family transcriptional regulator n=1 Tax=Shimazuella alba TaxID=2690964 RepID=A0A6I4VUB9_9BACL|nr:PadR family transcriptional regulator [Shimazuella alba]MXQ55167.1 PadR family transcriptional regulator [Shimazuella alba]
MPRADTLEMGELTDSAYYILLSLLEAKHGYSIMRSIEEMTSGTLSIGPASMYTTIKKLGKANLIKEIKTKDTQNKKTYVATESGISLLKKEIQRRRDMVRHAEEIFKTSKWSDAK